MSVEIIREGVSTARVGGEIDLANVDELENALDKLVLESPDGFVIDLTDTQYIDSAGIQAILRAYDHVSRGGGKIVVVAGNRSVKQIFGLIHPEDLPSLFLVDDLASAKAVFASRPEA